jgi:N-acetyltransferase 10
MKTKQGQLNSVQDVKAKQVKQLDALKKLNLSQYAIKGSEEEWSKALTSSATKSMISLKR